MRRLARADDLDAVHAIYMHPRVVPYLTHDPMPVAAFAGPFAGLVAAGSFFVWERDGAIAGFYRVQWGEGRSHHLAHLGLVAVDPHQHGRGVGKTMMLDALAQIEREGALRVELYAESDNATALALYEGLGFVREGVQRGGYLRDGQFLDDVVMVQFFGALKT